MSDLPEDEVITFITIKGRKMGDESSVEIVSNYQCGDYSFVESQYFVKAAIQAGYVEIEVLVRHEKVPF